MYLCFTVARTGCWLLQLVNAWNDWSFPIGVLILRVIFFYANLIVYAALSERLRFLSEWIESSDGCEIEISTYRIIIFLFRNMCVVLVCYFMSCEITKMYSYSPSLSLSVSMSPFESMYKKAFYCVVQCRLLWVSFLHIYENLV